ncbi:hypothetical protein Dda_8839 [Drechslerella dactyloides]|uniref:F-box domain-containing protein n=1 Tax=Drechslerella dactyloides TaxID=74499 RepID=A0AAD6IQB0_DREDA|nr:hypothetical protein Dda_8839 [Drechslerella dactyloides]
MRRRSLTSVFDVNSYQEGRPWLVDLLNRFSSITSLTMPLSLETLRSTNFRTAIRSFHTLSYLSLVFDYDRWSQSFRKPEDYLPIWHLIASNARTLRTLYIAVTLRWIRNANSDYIWFPTSGAGPVIAPGGTIIPTYLPLAPPPTYESVQHEIEFINERPACISTPITVPALKHFKLSRHSAHWSCLKCLEINDSLLQPELLESLSLVCCGNHEAWTMLREVHRFKNLRRLQLCHAQNAAQISWLLPRLRPLEMLFIVIHKSEASLRLNTLTVHRQSLKVLSIQGVFCAGMCPSAPPLPHNGPTWEYNVALNYSGFVALEELAVQVSSLDMRSSAHRNPLSHVFYTMRNFVNPKVVNAELINWRQSYLHLPPQLKVLRCFLDDETLAKRFSITSFTGIVQHMWWLRSMIGPVQTSWCLQLVIATDRIHDHELVGSPTPSSYDAPWMFLVAQNNGQVSLREVGIREAEGAVGEIKVAGGPHNTPWDWGHLP